MIQVIEVWYDYFGTLQAVGWMLGAAGWAENAFSFSLRLYGPAVNVAGRLPKQGGCEAVQEGEATSEKGLW